MKERSKLFPLLLGVLLLILFWSPANAQIQTATNEAALKGLVGPGLAYREGFWNAGDGGDSFYLWSTSNCLRPDGGAEVKPNTLPGCWFALMPPAGPSLALWGVVPGISVDTELNLAITWNCTDAALAEVGLTHPHTTVWIPTTPYNVPYQISTQINFGNGTGSGGQATAVSTQNNCSFRGVGGGASAAELAPARIPLPAVFQMQSGGAAIAFEVAGPAAGINLDGIAIDCNNTCSQGFYLQHPIGGDYRHLMVENWTSGAAYTLTAYSTAAAGVAVAVGAQHNTFVDLRPRFWRQRQRPLRRRDYLRDPRRSAG